MSLGNVLRIVTFGMISMTPMNLAAEDGWTRRTDMPTARFGVTTSVVDGRIYAIGGGVNRGDMVRNVQEYNPATDSWVEKANMPTATCWHSTSAVDGRIYAIGGWAPGAGIDTVVEYNPATDAWRARADMPTPRTFLSTSAVNGKIYAIGGLNRETTALPQSKNTTRFQTPGQQKPTCRRRECSCPPAWSMGLSMPSEAPDSYTHTSRQWRLTIRRRTPGRQRLRCQRQGSFSPPVW